MTVHRLYMEDAFLFTHQATITEIGQDDHGCWIKLDKTIFHPKGGGQLDDKGSINGIPVIAVINVDGGEIHHYLASDKSSEPGLVMGQNVLLEVDKQKRIENTALHSAGHILAFLAERTFPSIQATNAHHYPGQASVTFIQKKTIEMLPQRSEMQKTLQKLFEEAIESKAPITISNTQEGRKVIIADSSGVGCGGTHLCNAGQLRNFEIRSIKNRGRDSFSIGYNVSPSLQLLEEPEEEQTSTLRMGM